MQQLINTLKTKQSELDRIQKQMSDAQDRLRDLPEWQEWQQFKELEDILTSEIIQQRRLIKQTAIVNYEQTGDKNPIAGVKVIIKKDLIYDDCKALEWCMANAQDALKLLRPKFERYIRAVKETPLSNVSFVKVEERPDVRISRNL